MPNPRKGNTMGAVRSVEDQLQELVTRKGALEEEVEKIRDIKTINGATRKKKIDMEREIESIDAKMGELRGDAK